MVNFDNENTITTPPKDIIKILILERRKYVIDAIEDYQKKQGQGLRPDISILYSRLTALFYELKPVLKRSMEAPKLEALFNSLLSKSFDECIIAFDLLNEFMDTKKITRVDNFKEYDMTDPEAENEAFGL